MVDNELQINNYNNWLKMESNSGLHKENNSGELQIKNYSNSLLVMGLLQVINYSGRLQMENSGGFPGERQW